MQTYREELNKLNTYIEAGKAKQSIFSVNIFKFLHWIKIKLEKKPGYIDWISKNKNPFIMTDIIQVLYKIIEDVIYQMEITLDKKQFNHFKELEKITNLIINNFDKPIRSNPHIIYDENDDDNSDLNCNLLHKLENLIQIDIYLDEKIVNS